MKWWRKLFNRAVPEAVLMSGSEFQSFLWSKYFDGRDIKGLMVQLNDSPVMFTQAVPVGDKDVVKLWKGEVWQNGVFETDLLDAARGFLKAKRGY